MNHLRNAVIWLVVSIIGWLSFAAGLDYFPSHVCSSWHNLCELSGIIAGAFSIITLAVAIGYIVNWYDRHGD